MNRRFSIGIIAVIIFLAITTGCEVKTVNNQQNQQLSVQAWTFPGDKTCDATNDIKDITRHYDVLKPEYFTLNDDGTLKQLTIGCNAYSADNVALVKQHSTQQFVTISGNTAGMNALATSRNLTSAFLSAMYSFLDSSGFTGIELDFEGFGDWTPQQYVNYKALVTTIGNAMHARKSKLMIDVPAISDATYQKYYQLKYEELNISQVDYITIMAYDEMYDTGAGTPVSSLLWIINICRWALNKIDHNKIIMGINSYGYHGTKGLYNVTKDTYQQSTQLPGFNTAKRDVNSGEMMWSVNNLSYDYSDSITIQGKINAVLNNGINAISVWHLGGNQWFSQQIPTPSPAPTPQSSITLTQDQVSAIVDIFTPEQIASLKNMITG